jgi:Cof subfamily protein (haloacid dehalogenase superfamily)
MASSRAASRSWGDETSRRGDADALGGEYLLATDVDGTLLTRDYRLLPEVRLAVQHARSYGVVTMLATARGPAALEIVLRDLGPVDFAICFGGALVLKRAVHAWKPVLSARMTLAADDIFQIGKVARGLDLAVGAYTERGVHIGVRSDPLERELVQTGEPVLANGFETIVEPVFKMLAISDPGRVDDLEKLRLQLPRTIEGVYSHRNYLEMMVRGVSKGKALADFCSARGIDRSRVVAAGDSDNDVSMFIAAGHSAAMPDSSMAAKSAADWSVSADSPAALAAVIRHYAFSLWRIPAPPDPPNRTEHHGQ